jgi:hypothetical protein
MNIPVIGKGTRVPRDHAATADGVELAECLEAHKLDGTQVLQNRRLDKEEQQACPTPFRLM